MSKKIVIKKEGTTIHSKYVGLSATEAISMVGLSLGKMVHDRVDEKKISMDLLQETCEKILIPAFLRGAGCVLKEEAV